MGKTKIAVIEETNAYEGEYVTKETESDPKTSLQNVSGWNKAHAQLKCLKLAYEVRKEGLKAQKKSLEKAFDELYSTRPEKFNTNDTPLFNELTEEKSHAGTADVTIDLDNAIEAAAQIFAVAKDRLSIEELESWWEVFCASIEGYR